MLFIVMYMYTRTHTTVDYQVTKKSFKFARTHHLPFFFVSASDGTNVVKVCYVYYVVVHCKYTYTIRHLLDHDWLGVIKF